MKKIVVVLALLVLVHSTIFATDLSANVEIGTDIIKLNTGNTGNSEYFTSNNYDDVKVNFGIESKMFGAHTAIGVDANQKNISLYDTYAWVNLGDFAKITIGDFSSHSEKMVTNVIDEYKPGILRYGVPDSKHIGFNSNNTIEGDKLTNFVIDLYGGSTTLSFGINPYMNKAIPELNIKKYNLNIGGRAYATIGEFSYINITLAYNDSDKGLSDTADSRERTTIGAFIGSSRFLDTFGLMVGYTASILDGEVENGLDIRAEIPLGDIIIATHNNLSVYSDKQLVLYNEVKTEIFLTNEMATNLALRSQYYNSNGAIKDSVYDLGIYLGFDYAVTDEAIITTGFDVTGIGNNTTDVMISIPLKFKVSF